MANAFDTTDPVILGAVAYDAKVVPIWDGFRAFFAAHELPFDFVLFSNYERQVEAHFRGMIDVAWNSPLAWLQSERLAARLGREARTIGMRDTDRDLTSVVIVRADAGIESVAELRGKTVAVGAADSPQATLIPLIALQQAGLAAGACEVQRHDALVGKHGDHIGGERKAVKALLAGQADAACLIDGNLAAFTREGTLSSGSTRILLQTGAYDHCNFTVLDRLSPAKQAMIERFTTLLLGMSYDDPQLRPLLDMEGLKQWQDGRTSGYALLAAAIDTFGTIDEFLETMETRCG